MDVSSSPSENIIVANRSNPATPEVLPIQPKIENSPPASGRVAYEQSALHRQTVLMWGSGGSNQPSNEMPSPVSNTSSPSDSNPKHFNHHHSHNSTSSLHQQQSNDKCKSLESSQQQHHIKWNGNSAINGKEVISIFPIHHHSSEAYSPSSNTTNPPTTHPTIDTHSNHHHFHHRHSSEIPNCEVWTPYSQYQYFSYHHAHHQHQTSTQ